MIFFSGFLFRTVKVGSITAMIFFRLILHPAVSIYDFHILISSSSSFQWRVYNEPTKCPAPSWLVSSIGRALHRYRAEVKGSNPVQAWIFPGFLLASAKVASITAMIFFHFILVLLSVTHLCFGPHPLEKLKYPFLCFLSNTLFTSYPASRGYIFVVWAGVRKVEIWMNKLKKTGFLLFMTGLEHYVSLGWILRSRSELSQFLYSCETRINLRKTWRLILLANRVTNFAHARWKIGKLNGCRQRLLFARQLIQRKCSLCSQGIHEFIVPILFARRWVHTGGL